MGPAACDGERLISPRADLFLGTSGGTCVWGWSVRLGSFDLSFHPFAETAVAAVVWMVDQTIIYEFKDHFWSNN